MAAMYLKIKKDLLEKINAGIYEEGSLIPTEIELAEFYNVSRPTVRQAIQILVDNGYLEKRRKRGTMVCQRKIKQVFTQKISNFESEISEKVISTDTKVISVKLENPSEEVANALEISLSEKVFKLIRLRYINSNPNIVITTYVPYSLFSDIESFDFNNMHLHDYFYKKRNPVIKVRRKLETIKADDTVANLLDIQKDDPIFYFHSYGYGANDKVIEYSVSKYRSDMNYFLLDLYM